MLGEALLRRGTDSDLDEAQKSVDRLAAVPTDPGFVLHERDQLQILQGQRHVVREFDFVLLAEILEVLRLRPAQLVEVDLHTLLTVFLGECQAGCPAWHHPDHVVVVAQPVTAGVLHVVLDQGQPQEHLLARFGQVAHLRVDGDVAALPRR